MVLSAQLLCCQHYAGICPTCQNPENMAHITGAHPRNQPDTAISLMSPPPKAPGISSVSSNMGTAITKHRSVDRPVHAVETAQ